MNPIPILEVNHQLDPLDISNHSNENWNTEIETNLKKIAVLFGSGPGDYYCGSSAVYYITTTTTSYAQSINVVIPSSQLSLVNALYLKYSYIRIA